eukprot:gene4062-2912_t
MPRLFDASVVFYSRDPDIFCCFVCLSLCIDFFLFASLMRIRVYENNSLNRAWFGLVGLI